MYTFLWGLNLGNTNEQKIVNELETKLIKQ